MSAKPKVFIDGEHGTTGLQIRQRLAGRDDVEVLSLAAADRRDADKRARLLNEADIAILCLPDDGAREAVAMLAAAGNGHTRVIDASTAHRTADGWVFGFAEMTRGQRQAIAAARFVANPGCYSTGSIALLRPLIERQVLPPAYPVTINAVSGYSGGGKSLIAQMEDSSRDDHIGANLFLYALTLAHKHVPEIMLRAGLTRRPVMTPNVGRFAQGMLVNLPLHLDLLNGAPDVADIHALMSEHYAGQDVVRVAALEQCAQLPRVDAEEMVGTDEMRLYVFGTPGRGQVNLVASLDNLGKGASGAAVQNLDIMLNGRG
ncbi:MAG: N-acetyl-gamma-glutamyl-phosphate reductase [Alphaproteobacteria bacterium]|nr:MAG: N-acetyl-gamma-glutamyl-phosphate reductase [Alphaproteobacteria bacterium]